MMQRVADAYRVVGVLEVTPSILRAAQTGDGGGAALSRGTDRSEYDGGNGDGKTALGVIMMALFPLSSRSDRPMRAAAPPRADP